MKHDRVLPGQHTLHRFDIWLPLPAILASCLGLISAAGSPEAMSLVSPVGELHARPSEELASSGGYTF
jgi:hypothetical protein